MKPRKLLLIAALISIACLSRAEMEANSFLVRPAPTHVSFMNQVRTDKAVMDRYMRHFRMSREEVIQYLGSLHLTKLDQDFSCRQYGVPRNGVLHSRECVLKKGEPVFADMLGNPILRVKCGNPLVSGMDDVKTPLTSGIVENEPSLKDLVASTGAITPEDQVLLSVPEIPVLPEVTPELPPVEEVTPVVPQVASSNNKDLAWLLLLGGVGGGHGGNHNEPVPEPASMAVLAVGAGALLARRRRR